MNLSKFNFKIIQIDSVESTNIYAQKLLEQENVQEGTVLQTNYQKKGKGQLGEAWESMPNKNLLFSIVLRPELRVENQFLLSKAISIGLKNFLDSMSVGEITIKWPNDLLINGEKVAGILIENSICRSLINTAVVGIGLNVNQLEFQEYQRSATSLAKLSGKCYDLNSLLPLVLEQIRLAYLQINATPVQLNRRYLQALHGLGKSLKYEDQEGVFKGVILGVLPSGRLQLNREGKLKNYELKELKFLS